MTIAEFQKIIRRTYLDRDSARAGGGTFLWFVEEVGELAEAIRTAAPAEEIDGEFADVLAWLMSLANIHGVDVERAAAAKYGSGCPSCGEVPCVCVDPSRGVT